MDDMAARMAVVETARAMTAAGLATGTAGNVSVRVGAGFLVTPSGRPYGTMGAGEVVEMDLDGGYVGALLPSSEWRMHQAIYRERDEAGAVVHSHSPHAAALSGLRRGIPAFHYMVAVAGGEDIRCADYATFGTEALSRNMMAALEGRRACLLANHGVICFGPDAASALALAVEVEGLAQQYLLALRVGEPAILDKAEMDRVLRAFSTYGRQLEELEPGEEPAFLPPQRRDARSRGGS